MSSSDPAVRPVTLPELHPTRPSGGGDGREAGLGAVREGQRIARAIVARATERAREIQASAQADGFAQGQAAALEREGGALRAASAALAAAAARLEAARRELDARVVADLPDLVTRVAGAVLGRELSLRPELLAELVRDGLAAVLPASRICVRVHPGDLETIERHRAQLTADLGAAELRIEATEEVGPGGCVVDTEALRLGAGLPERLERALAVLTDPDPAA
jgi:flagellar assembly protein FliH